MKKPAWWAACLLILLAAGGTGILFNLAAPQGIGWLPREVARPLWREIDLARAQRLWQEGVLFVDARDPGHYKLAHVRRAVGLNPQEWEILYPLLRPQLKGAAQVVVYGRSLSRFPAATVAQRLAQDGVGQVWVLGATFEQWRQAGLPSRVRKVGRAG